MEIKKKKKEIFSIFELTTIIDRFSAILYQQKKNKKKWHWTLGWKIEIYGTIFSFILFCSNLVQFSLILFKFRLYRNCGKLWFLTVQVWLLHFIHSKQEIDFLQILDFFFLLDSFRWCSSIGSNFGCSTFSINLFSKIWNFILQFSSGFLRKRSYNLAIFGNFYFGKIYFAVVIKGLYFALAEFHYCKIYQQSLFKIKEDE